MSTSPPPKTPRRTNRFAPFAFIFILSVFIFVGGIAAILYWLFSQYSGVRNVWILFCGAPLLLIILVMFTIVTLYTRYGKPVEQIVRAIDSIAEGDLSARVPEDNSPQFERIIKRFNKMVGELERSDQQRRNLTADIAHELRTPLHIIQGNLEGILDGVYRPSQGHITATLDETRLLTRLVDDLQTLSLAETGQLPLHPARFLLADLISDLDSSFSSQAESQGVDLLRTLAEPERELTADYDRLDQVLSNLISNALRHTPRGGTVSIETDSIVDDGEELIRIKVRDTGAGIASEDLPFVFDRFWRSDRSRSERTHSGLGLAIAKQLILAHGGSIDVQSEPGRGTTFTLHLPLK